MLSNRSTEEAIPDPNHQRKTGRFRCVFLALTAVAFAGVGCSSSGGGSPTKPQGGTAQVGGGSGGNGQGAGGTPATGGELEAGGSAATGGLNSSGGVTPNMGGTNSSGGAIPTAGSASTGGTTPRGGTTATTGAGGTAVTGGLGATGGTIPRGGTTGTTTTGGSGLGGSSPGTGGQTSTTPGTCPTVASGPAPDTTTRAKCTSTSTGIACHFGGNPGNYDVSFNLGGTAAGQTQVQAETWREMLAAPVTVAGTPVASIATSAGQKVLYSMTVNVRDPEGQPNWTVSAGTPGLDMYFIGSAPQLDSIAYAPAATSDIVLYIATDSTGCDQPGNGTPGGAGTAGWGQWLPQFFGPGIAVANYGNSGALTECSPSTTPCESDLYRSFYDDSKMWPAVKPLLKTGDVVLIEFAHNDKQTPQAQYEANLTTYIKETRAAGAIPVLATPIPRNSWSGGAMSATFVNNVGVNLLASIKSVATANNVPLIDINAKVVAAFSAKGQATVSGYYADPTTHLNTTGANFVAGLIRDAIKSQNLSPLVCYLR